MADLGKRRQFVRFVRRHPALKNLANAAEIMVFGSRARADLLKAALDTHYRSVDRRWWGWQSQGEPHFSLHERLFFDLFRGTGGEEAYALSRAFFSSEVVLPGDTILDIGCGDGSFTKRFYAPHAEHVDAVDIEPGAIAYANAYNAAPNIKYARLDATAEPFPSSAYGLVVFDGALGHFSAASTDALLAKIAANLTPEGVFCGSESVGRREGVDHLQFFDELDDLRTALSKSFRYVQLRQVNYGPRTEGFWRCANSPVRLDSLAWR